MIQRGRLFLTILLIFCLVLLSGNAKAQSSLADTEDKTLDISSFIIFADDAGREAYEIDSLFFLRSFPVIFKVSRTDVITNNGDLQQFIRYGVPLLKNENIRNARIRIRSAASPEGPLSFNKQLSLGRRDALLKIFEENGVDASELQIDVVDEEYELLAFMMRQAHDPDALTVSRMVADWISDPVKLKNELMHYGDGHLWERIKEQYFPQLRASRFMIIFPDNFQSELLNTELVPLDFSGLENKSVNALPDRLPEISLLPSALILVPPSTPRRELLAIKTNLLEWGAYVPQYGFCPMPNVELEYYPRHGHWTLGATFDCPWWIGNTTNHKYFELRNYQLYGRYYFRNSDHSYSNVLLAEPIAGQAAFRGFYLEGYAQACLYQIGFSAQKGWIGEGAGGGLGAGYTLPLSRDGHWRLDMGFQLGLFRTYYDPFVYGKPVYHGGEIDGNYYYDTDLYSDEFVKRMHRFTWLGPTRAGISISYDLLYRKRDSKRPSFSKWERGGVKP